MKWLPVLQIFHRWVADYRHLRVLTLPDKIRHREITEVEISVSLILSNRVDVCHYGLQDARWNDDASFIVEEYIVLSIAVVWSCELAD